MTNRPIPCPECGGDGNWHHGDDGVPGMIGIGCGACMGTGTIPDRRSLTAAGRAVERIKAWADKMCGEDCACCQSAGGGVLDIIREEEGR